MRMPLFALAAFAVVSTVGADESRQLRTSELAAAFGTAPIMWGMHLSPDGSKISALQMHASGVPIARVVDFGSGSNTVVLSGQRDVYDVSWCDWANNERLLCGMRGLYRAATPSGQQTRHFVLTRLIAAGVDGSETKLLVNNYLEPGFSQFQDRVIDWLPDDPEHVLIQTSSVDLGGYGVSRLNIYEDGLTIEERPKSGAYRWIADGYGAPRLYRTTTDTTERWYVRDEPEGPWNLLHETTLAVPDAFVPIGFGSNRNELLFADEQEGKAVLYAMDLANGRARRLVYAHPEVDVTSVHTLGRHRRVVGAGYVEGTRKFHFFDRRVADIHEALTKVFPEKGVVIVDESWDQRYYIAFVNGPTDPGTYYRFDVEMKQLARIVSAYPQLAEQPMSDMNPVRFTAEDGAVITAYLTLPAGKVGRLPTAILLGGGPLARDYWPTDFLAQFLAARGFAVLQIRYRNSGGYDRDWLGGGFGDWQRTVADITASTKYLVDQGVTDAARICTVGWGYGGYAALLSAIENQSLYRCVASIGGVTDPEGFSSAMRQIVGGVSERMLIGVGGEVFDEGSPLARVREVNVPVMLVHGRKDDSVPFQQATLFANALERAEKSVELIEYENADHMIWDENYRVDLLVHLGEFLGAHLDR